MVNLITVLYSFIIPCHKIVEAFIHFWRNAGDSLNIIQESFVLYDSIHVVNRGKPVGSLAKFFVLCFCSLFWPRPCTNTIAYN